LTVRAGPRGPIRERTTLNTRRDHRRYVEVTPAYGRDYKSAKAAQLDWRSGKDWILQDFQDPADGKPINKADADAAGLTVILRFDALRKVAKS
jgi:hypothetical protein